MNESDSWDVFTALCQCKTKQLSITAADGTVHIQQCVKQNHRKDII